MSSVHPGYDRHHNLSFGPVTLKRWEIGVRAMKVSLVSFCYIACWSRPCLASSGARYEKDVHESHCCVRVGGLQVCRVINLLYPCIGICRIESLSQDLFLHRMMILEIGTPIITRLVPKDSTIVPRLAMTDLTECEECIRVACHLSCSCGVDRTRHESTQIRRIYGS
ncbi:hypothetical protein BD310DRAFT_669748 [Dichomitus squalens]|uniref:Uncharacterized protein n=1 Tax=Dichomitus squalens TaxID=114155 RepID=A0A4Q9PNL5_9APHY|nr:hypothetical protein BD310DRAFT_669748 [Dichomitus squalens]